MLLSLWPARWAARRKTTALVIPAPACPQRPLLAASGTAAAVGRPLALLVSPQDTCAPGGVIPLVIRVISKCHRSQLFVS